MILAGFEHRPGVHDGTAALADALRTQGVELSEPMAFGLCAGLGFHYVVSPDLSPTHLFFGRSLRLEETAREVIGTPPRPLEEMVREALRRQAREFLLDVDGAAGISALERFAAELQDWPSQASDEADRAWCFRVGCQVIERPGTGGGNFRGLYARFLEEAEARVPGLAPLGLSPRMRAVAAAWTRLSEMLRAISEVPGGLVPPPVREHVRALARDERRYHEDVAALVR